MPKLRNRPPKMCHRKDLNVAYVSFNSEKIYLGKWGTKEALAKYQHFVNSWVLGKKQSPKTLFNSEIASLEDLFDGYIADYQSRPIVQTSDLHLAQTVANRVNELFPSSSVNDFGPKALEAVRNSFLVRGYVRGGIRRPYTRQYLNRIAKKIREIFKWGCYQEMVPIGIYEALKTVPPLRAGRTSAIESRGRRFLSDEEIETVLDYLQPVYADIIRILFRTGMRPSELCKMRIGDIDRSDEKILIYRPSSHKTEYRGKKRFIPLGEHSQKILLSYLEGRGPEEFVFSPLTIMEEYWRIRAKARKTKVQPSQLKRNKIANLRKRKRFLLSLDSQLIATAVRKACTKAIQDGKLTQAWTPYELRHTAITKIRIREGAEAAQHFAGHSNLRTQDFYDHSALIKAIEVAEKYG